MKKVLFLFIVLSLFLFSCKKEVTIDKYIIFKSDSTNVFGVLDGRTINQNIAYKVLYGQRVEFRKSNYLFMFKVNVQLGPDNYNSPNNITYSLNNEYIFIIRQ